LTPDEDTATRDAVAPTVAMIVLNDISIDSRVKKTAASVAALGCQVTLVGRSLAHRRTGEIGGIPTVWVRDAGTFRTLALQGNLGEVSPSSRSVVTRTINGLVDRTRVTQDRYRIRRAKLKLSLRYLETPQRPSTGGRGPNNRLGKLRFIVGRRRHRIRRRVIQLRINRLDAAHNRYLGQRSSKSIVKSHAAASNSSRRRGIAERKGRLHDWEMAFGVELDRISADIVHVHDIYLLGIACRYKARQLARGRTVYVIYDAHEYMAGTVPAPGSGNEVLIALEKEYAPLVDRYITVSPMIRRWLIRDLHLSPEAITVTMNAPALSESNAKATTSQSVRDAVGLGPDVPLVIYSGGISEERGVGDLVDAIARLQGVHCVLVAPPHNKFAREQLERAVELNIADRLHLADFVAPEAVSDYLSSATLAVHPLRRYKLDADGSMQLVANHDAALPNKLFEYLHARLPVVLSDCAAMTSFLDEHPVGRRFIAGNPDSLAEAISSVLESPGPYRAAITDDLIAKYSWNAQTSALRELYAGLVGDEALISSVEADGAVTKRLSALDRVRSEVAFKAGADRSRVHTESVLIGPLNTAGQADQWAAAMRSIYRVNATSETLQRSNSLPFDADQTIYLDDYTSLAWQTQRLRTIPAKYSHLICESGISPLGNLNGGRLVDDLGFFKARSIALALVLHGSEIRNPTRHAAREQFSPFHQELNGLTKTLAQRSARTRGELERFDGPVFCTTPDLLDEFDPTYWLPTVVSFPVLDGTSATATLDRPRVLYAPSRSALKAGADVEQVLEELSAANRIDYRRLNKVPHDQLLIEVKDADIIIDQFLIGSYGVAAVEAMAAGKIVVGHVSDAVRELVPLEIPIVEATPLTFPKVMDEIVGNLEFFSQQGRRGVDYAHAFHDGRCSARQIYAWITGESIERIPSPEVN
jgi:glycosyltransferase involved in cell wall biosynthesis